MKKYKYFIIICLLVFIISITGSYAYFAYQATNTTAIVGNIVSIDADLTVERVVGTNAYMVPLQDNALSNAINGVGSNTPCIDSNGSLSCQVYKITLSNNASRLKNLKGTIELYAKSGSGNVYNNLKWQELSTTTSIKNGSSSHGMSKSTLVSDLTLESKETKIWYIAVWISEIDSDQKNTDKGNFGGTVTFEVSNGESLYETIKDEAVMDNTTSTYVTSTTGIDFTAISSDTNGKGIYIRSGTENDTYPIYYYRGAVTNNNVLFANFCWKIVRTTETGGIKLIYNGTPSNGTCNNTGDNSQIGISAFNSSYASPAYVGYMYGTSYPYIEVDMSQITGNIQYGKSVNYTNGTYTLTDTITSNSWSSIYNTTDGIYNHHYTCLSTGNTCSSVYYIYYTNDSTAYYITLTNGKKVEDALSDMLDNNTTNSNIGERSIDSWYSQNMTSYTNKLEDTIWCNDRSIYQLNGWNPDGGTTTGSWTGYSLLFGAYGRTQVTANPVITCNFRNSNVDKFTVSSSIGNGVLTYPVGLLTADEVILAGANNGHSSNSTYYLNTGKLYWLASPFSFDNAKANAFIVYSLGSLSNGGGVYGNLGVRPSISLAPGTTFGVGNGTSTNPYIVT